MSGAVDSVARRWFPRVGDQVMDIEMLRYGVVLDVRQTASAPATVTVCLEPDAGEAGAGDWHVFERGVEQLERDIRNDVTPPSFEELKLTVDEAAVIVLGACVELALYRARVSTSDELASALQADADRAARLARAHADQGRYDMAARELEVFDHLRTLCVAVRTIARLEPAL